MDVTLQNAALAYGKAIGRAGEAGQDMPAAGIDGGGSAFADMVKAAGEQTAQALGTAEQVSAASNVSGAVELTDVVQAVNNAEIALQTVVAVRDRVVDAYQQIIRMPI
jgi:flagellar hook-basal body complex protein FliE